MIRLSREKNNNNFLFYSNRRRCAPSWVPEARRGSDLGGGQLLIAHSFSHLLGLFPSILLRFLIFLCHQSSSPANFSRLILRSSLWLQRPVARWWREFPLDVALDGRWWFTSATPCSFSALPSSRSGRKWLPKMVWSFAKIELLSPSRSVKDRRWIGDELKVGFGLWRPMFIGIYF